MEYQQFVNFLKKQKCYNKFFRYYLKYPCMTKDVFNLTLEERFNKYPDTPLTRCLSFSSIINCEDVSVGIFWGRLHLLWRRNYIK